MKYKTLRAVLFPVSIAVSLLSVAATASMVVERPGHLTSGFHYGIAGLRPSKQGPAVVAMYDLISSLPNSGLAPLSPGASRLDSLVRFIKTERNAPDLSKAVFETVAGVMDQPGFASDLSGYLKRLNVPGHPGMGEKMAQTMWELSLPGALAGLSNGPYDFQSIRSFFDLGRREGYDPSAATFLEEAMTSDAALQVNHTHYRGIGDFIEIPPGIFLMGSREFHEPGRTSDERLHIVTMVRPFQVAKDVVPQSLFSKVMGYNPASQKGDNLPAVGMTYEQALEFVARLNQKMRTAFRLLRETEWERMARAGEMGSLYGNINNVAWYLSNAQGRLQQIGTRLENRWGIRPFSGIREWTTDRFVPYPKGHVVDHDSIQWDPRLVSRGANVFSTPEQVRLANRSLEYPNGSGLTGIRLASGQ